MNGKSDKVMALPLPMALCLSPGSTSRSRTSDCLITSIIPEFRSNCNEILWACSTAACSSSNYMIPCISAQLILNLYLWLCPKNFLAIRSELIEALRQSPVQLQDMDPGLKHRAVGSGATSKAMALPLFPFTNIFA